MKKSAILITSILLAANSYAADIPKSEDEKTLYTIGVTLSKTLSVFNLAPKEFEFVKQGLIDAQAGKKSEFDTSAYNVKVQELAKKRRKELGERERIAGKEFIEKTAKEEGVKKLQSGMLFKSTKEGSGISPKATDVVKVNYRGTLINGKEFDSSYKRGKPLEFKLENVIKCWQEGLQMVKTGGSAKLVCPPNLAYGENGVGDTILPGAYLVFDVELLEVIK